MGPRKKDEMRKKMEFLNTVIPVNLNLTVLSIDGRLSGYRGEELRNI